MNVSSPANAADYNEQPPPTSSTPSKPPSECTTSAGILPSSIPDAAQSASGREPTATGFPTFARVGAPQKFHPERFASQATAAALSLCADSDSPEEEGPSSASHPSKLPSLNRQNRKCKSAVIQVDGRSFTIGENLLVLLNAFYLFNFDAQKSKEIRA